MGQKKTTSQRPGWVVSVIASNSRPGSRLVTARSRNAGKRSPTVSIVHVPFRSNWRTILHRGAKKRSRPPSLGAGGAEAEHLDAHGVGDEAVDPPGCDDRVEALVVVVGHLVAAGAHEMVVPVDVGVVTLAVA